MSEDQKKKVPRLKFFLAMLATGFACAIVWAVTFGTGFIERMGYVEYPHLADVLSNRSDVKSLEITSIERSVTHSLPLRVSVDIDSPICGGTFEHRDPGAMYFYAYVKQGKWRVYAPEQFMNQNSAAAGVSRFEDVLDSLLSACEKKASW